MCPSVILHVLQAVAFELCQSGLLDGTTGCQLKNDYAVCKGSHRRSFLFLYLDSLRVHCPAVYKRSPELQNGFGSISVVV
jgi:hypothetical protein